MTKVSFSALDQSDNQDDFIAAVANINERGESLQLDIQKYMTAVAVRWQQTGDVRPAVLRINLLIDKSKRFKGGRWNAVLAYVEAAFGFIFVTEGDAANTFIKGTTTAKQLDMHMFLEQKNFWWNFVPEPDYAPMNLNAEIAALLKKVDNCQKEGSKRKLEASPEVMDALRALAASAKADEAVEGAVRA